MPTFTRGVWTQSGGGNFTTAVWKSDGTAQIQDGSVIPNGQTLGQFVSNGRQINEGAFQTWVTSTWDTSRNQMVHTSGSGDQSWTSNEVNVFDLTVGSWNPAGRPMDPTTRLYVKTGTGNVWAPGTSYLGNNNPAAAAPWALVDTTGLYHTHALPNLLDGRFMYPNGRQHYGGMLYMPSVDKVFMFGGFGWWASGQGSLIPWEWDPAARTWQAMTTDMCPVSPCTEPLMAWDSTQNRVLMFAGDGNDALAAYYPGNAHGNRWAVLQNHLADVIPVFGTTSINYGQLVYDSRRKWLWMFAGHMGAFHGTVIRWDLSVTGSPTSTQQVSLTGDVGWNTNVGPGVLYDPVADIYVAWTGGKTLYRMTPPASLAGTTMASVATTPGGAVTPSAPFFVWNRFAYLPTYDAYATISQATDTGAFVFAPIRVAPPVLACTDLASGPRAGNADTAFGQIANQDGAYVTIFGFNFGNVEDTRTATCGGAPMRIVDFGQCNGTAGKPPATTYNQYMKLQYIVGQVSHLATVGAGVIDVVVNGQASTVDLPFTVTATGHVYYAPGNFTSVQNLLDGMVGGDVGYVRAPLNAPGGVVMGGNTGQQSNGQQIALGAYPGTAVQFGDSNHDAVIEGPSGSGQNLTLFKCNMVGNSVVPFQAVTLKYNGRFVGNKLQVPGGQGKAGALGVIGGNLAVLANEFTNCGALPTDDQYHVIYRYGDRNGQGIVESGFRGAYNYFHGNNAARAFNIFNDQDPILAGAVANPIANHEVDHNVIVDQQFAGIGFQAGVVGTNTAHDNLLIRCGLGAFATAVQLNAGYPQGWTGARSPISIAIERNTFLNCGDSGFPGTSSVLYVASSENYSLVWRNNLADQANGQPYVKIAVFSSVGPDPSLRSHNLWFGSTDAPPTFDTAPLTGNPLVVSAVTPFDLHLQSTSPCIGAGTSLASPSYDLDGVARPVGSACDIGAYQFGPGAAEPPPPPVTVSLALVFTGLTVDRVGQGGTALGPDGANDGVVTVTLTTSDSTPRTITGLVMHCRDSGGAQIGQWDTTADAAGWVLGVALTPSGTLLNAAGSMAVNFTVASGGIFVVIGSDAIVNFNVAEFAPGNTLTVTATCSDGTTTTGSVTIAGASPPTLASLNPSSGPAGITVQLLGTNFSTTPGGNIVRFGTTPATILSEGPTAIFCTVPLQPDAVYDVTVTTSAGPSNPLPFTAITLAGAGYGHPAVRTRFRRWS